MTQETPYVRCRCNYFLNSFDLQLVGASDVEPIKSRLTALVRKSPGPSTLKCTVLASDLQSSLHFQQGSKQPQQLLHPGDARSPGDSEANAKE